MYELALVVVPPQDGGLSSVLTKAEILINPYFHLRHHVVDDDDACTCGGVWDHGIVGYRFTGRLWLDRYGRLPEGRSFGEPVEEIRKVADIDPRATGLAPSALITADGGIHHMGSKPHGMFASLADRAEMEDRLMANPDYFAVPYACHC